ncbi:Modification methylase NgoPII (M.NgoPII) (Cytosine-specific methyltransferase NgoPII) [Durusdinium trenchii]|uniref:Modification methylase NgoPII (M.NgoPII) (Cytosine-specific methyltransferase NgoPII) n=1 Tax=Durusdinium trenchii TaxID=1381693 RepID=A0ABP0H8V4_9DINO
MADQMCVNWWHGSGLFPDIARFNRPLNVTMPCVGIDGCGVAMQHMAVRFKPTNVYDLEHRYEGYLQHHFGDVPLHLGKDNGDINKLKMENVERPVDLLVSGPPCPPWAGQGKHHGQSDIRAEVFLTVVRLMISLIKSGDLFAAVIENVKGICQKIKGLEVSFMDQLLEALNKEADEFSWDTVILHAKDYMLAQTLVLARKVCETVDRSSLTKVMRQNLMDAEKKLQQAVADGEYGKSDLIVFPLDRADGKAYKRSYSVNMAPTLTTNNTYLFVTSLDFKKRTEGKGQWKRLPYPILQELQPHITGQLKVKGSLLDESATKACTNFDKFMATCSAAAAKAAKGRAKQQKKKGGAKAFRPKAKPLAKRKAKAKAQAKQKGARGGKVKKTIKKVQRKSTGHYKYRFLSSSSS